MKPQSDNAAEQFAKAYDEDQASFRRPQQWTEEKMKAYRKRLENIPRLTKACKKDTL